MPSPLRPPLILPRLYQITNPPLLRLRNARWTKGHSNAQKTMKTMKRRPEGSNLHAIWRSIELPIYACVEQDTCAQLRDEKPQKKQSQLDESEVQCTSRVRVRDPALQITVCLGSSQLDTTWPQKQRERDYVYYLMLFPSTGGLLPLAVPWYIGVRCRTREWYGMVC